MHTNKEEETHVPVKRDEENERSISSKSRESDTEELKAAETDLVVTGRRRYSSKQQPAKRWKQTHAPRRGDRQESRRQESWIRRRMFRRPSPVVPTFRRVGGGRPGHRDSHADMGRNGACVRERPSCQCGAGAASPE